MFTGLVEEVGVVERVEERDGARITLVAGIIDERRTLMRQLEAGIEALTLHRRNTDCRRCPYNAHDAVCKRR